MGRFFENDLHDEFGSWPLGYTATGGPDVGVIEAVGTAVGDGDDGAFHDAWMAAGDRFAAEAEAAEAEGHRASACAGFLAAAACYATSYHRSTAPRSTRAWSPPSAPRSPPSTRASPGSPTRAARWRSPTRAPRSPATSCRPAAAPASAGRW